MAWIAIYVLVPMLMLIVLVVQARARDRTRRGGRPARLDLRLLAVQAIVLLGFGVALFAVPAHAAPCGPGN